MPSRSQRAAQRARRPPATRGGRRAGGRRRRARRRAGREERVDVLDAVGVRAAHGPEARASSRTAWAAARISVSAVVRRRARRGDQSPGEATRPGAAARRRRTGGAGHHALRGHGEDERRSSSTAPPACRSRPRGSATASSPGTSRAPRGRDGSMSPAATTTARYDSAPRRPSRSVASRRSASHAADAQRGDGGEQRADDHRQVQRGALADRVRVAHRRRVGRVLQERHEEDATNAPAASHSARARGAGAADAPVGEREGEREEAAERDAVDDGGGEQADACAATPRVTSSASSRLAVRRWRCAPRRRWRWSTAARRRRCAKPDASRPAAEAGEQPADQEGADHGVTAGSVAGEAEQVPAVVHELVHVVPGTQRGGALVGADEVEQHAAAATASSAYGQISRRLIAGG